MREQLVKLLGLQEKDVAATEVRQIPIELITVNPYQPRKHFSQEGLDDLAKSIQNFGIIQPLLLRRQNSGYELIAGERRLRAATMNGLQVVPALLVDYSDQEMAEVALIENLQREDLGFMDEAEGYRLLLEEFGLTQEELARRVGKSQSTIANKLRLLRLPEEVRQNISQEIITERHARALLKLKTDKQQLFALQEVYEKKLNVRETENLVEKMVKPEPLLSGPSKIPGKNRNVIKIVRDARIILNTIRQLVKDMQNSGIAMTFEEIDREEEVQVIISIPKMKVAQK